MTQVKILNVLSKVATPHNNNLMKAILDSGKCKLKIFYNVKSTTDYQWEKDHFNEIGNPKVLGYNSVNFKLLWHGLTHPEENWLFIGWPNLTARILIVFFGLLNRPFMFWSDLSDKYKKLPAWIALVRRFLYYIVKVRASHIFLVGEMAVQYYMKEGFPPHKLINLPIFVSLNKKKNYYNKNIIRKKYHIPSDSILFISGSRLIKAKGFDILVEAAQIVIKRTDKSIKVIIVGKGKEETKLKRMVKDLNLLDIVLFEEWLEIEEFEALIAASDVYVHPARFDAFGGGTLHAMALGVPVVGSNGAGVVVERVKHGLNGFIFKSEDVNELAKLMEIFVTNPAISNKMGKEARQTAEEWPREKGAKIIIDALF